MSLATLKKKTAHKYRNNSTQGQAFSLNGSYRNQGYIGQTSLSRTILRTPASGPESQGHGSCCGQYVSKTLCNSTASSTEDNQMVKPSVLSYKGMIQKRTQWSRRPAPHQSLKPSDSDYLVYKHQSVKPSDSAHLKSSSDYLVYKRKKAIQECNAPGYKPAGDCCPAYVKTKEDLGIAKSQGDYIFELIGQCANLDISYVEYNQHNANAPIPLCGL